MKKLLTLLTLLLALGLTCAFAEDEPTTYTSGDYKYVLLEDGTAQITGYWGRDKDWGRDKEVTVPAELDGHAVTTIGDEAFSSCRSLTSITIGNGVTTIGDSAFYWCESLTSITLPDSVTTIGDGAFSHCNKLTSITIPDSVTTIGDNAFQSCKSLTSIILPDSVTTIGKTVFSKCESLKAVTVTRDSFAEQYCKDNNLPYTYPDANDWLLN